MSFGPVRGARGQSRLSCICDECRREEVIPAVHGKHGADGQGQAVVKLQRLGWSYIGKRLRCPTCEAKRKVGKMNDVKTRAAHAVPESPRMASKEQKREIIDLLRDVYDVEHECYRRGDTDATVADVLGVMPGWVAELREELFGAAGGNEDMAALSGEVNGFLTSARVALATCEKQVTALRAEIGRAEQFSKRLTGIEQAVGPHVLKRVKG